MRRTKKKRDIEQYEHIDQERLNNPETGLVSGATDPATEEKKKYEHDPHIDPMLQWAGKKEHTSFEVPTVSLHIHEQIDSKRIVEEIKREETGPRQLSLFQMEKKSLREAVEFYKHRLGWKNRLVAGDSLLVMNSLLEKEGMAGKVQTIYFDPPYGIKYGSNFQPFVNQRNVRDGKDADLSAEPETIKAFRDTWELGIHSYLTHLRDRLLLARELLHESGSIFVQISDENVHRVRCLLDEVFGAENFVSLINFRKKTMPLGTKLLEQLGDYIIFYSKNKEKIKYRPLYKATKVEGDAHWNVAEFKNANRKQLTTKEIRNHSIVNQTFDPCRLVSMSPIGFTADRVFEVEIDGKKYVPARKKSWKTDRKGMERLKVANRLVSFKEGDRLNYLLKLSDYPITAITANWNDTSAPSNMRYAVETSVKPIQRCILMTSDPGDLVLDITCGSGTTAYVAEQWGRRWITCDTSRVAVTLAKQRLMTAFFDYYRLADPQKKRVSKGFKYKTVPHVTLKSIANNETPKTETLYDQPLKDTSKVRVSGPFTVEAVPSLHAKSQEEIEQENHGSGESVARSGETLRQAVWRDELLKTGIRAKDGGKIEFSRLEPMSGTRWIQCEAETKEDDPQKVLIVFGPEHAPLDQRMVEEAWQEAKPFRPDMLLFCAFQFDEKAAQDIDELKPEIVKMQLLKVQMNSDLFTDDLKKKRAGNDSFWLIGQPDVEVHRITKGEHKGLYRVEVQGFDYYNPKTGNVDSGGKNNIAMWQLDTDYDKRSLFPVQVFFPMASKKDGWGKLAKNLKAEVDTEKIEEFRGTISLPFAKGQHSRIAVKIIDDRGIESLRVIDL